MSVRSVLVVSGMAAAAIPLSPDLAFGYIDPGTGSFMLQIAAAAFFGSVLAIKVSWSKIRSVLGNMTRSRTRTADDEAGEG